MILGGINRTGRGTNYRPLLMMVLASPVDCINLCHIPGTAPLFESVWAIGNSGN